MRGPLLLFVLICLPAFSDAAVLKSEPGEGQLRSGQRVLVDDGSCPAGQIKEVVGGINRKYRTTIRRPGTTRSTSCIAR